MKRPAPIAATEDQPPKKSKSASGKAPRTQSGGLFLGGTAKAKNGSALGSVTVTIWGPALPEGRTSITQPDGSFSFSNLPEGEYYGKATGAGISHGKLVLNPPFNPMRLKAELRRAKKMLARMEQPPGDDKRSRKTSGNRSRVTATKGDIALPRHLRDLKATFRDPRLLEALEARAEANEKLKAAQRIENEEIRQKAAAPEHAAGELLAHVIGGAAVFLGTLWALGGKSSEANTNVKTD